jgi:hypothetical protein
MSEQASKSALITGAATIIAALISAVAGFWIGQKAADQKTIVKPFIGSGISIQFRGDGQRIVAGKIATKLLQREFDVRLIEPVNNSPSKTEVRYFRLQDKDEANTICELIKEYTGKDTYALQARGQIAEAKHFEIWLGPNVTGEE